MKKEIFILALSVLCVANIFAQKIDIQTLEFDYIRNPLNPLPESIKNYSSQVILDYEQGILELQKLNKEGFQEAFKKYERELPIAQRKYDSLMEIYSKAKEKAIAKYDSEIVEYRKKPNIDRFFENKILKDSERPHLDVDMYMKYYPQVRFPYKPYEQKEDYQKIFNKDVLAESYLKLDGYTKSNVNAVKIIVTLFGFEFLDPVLRNESANVYNSNTKQTTTVIKYWYEISYRHPMKLKIIAPDGKVIKDYTFEELANYTVYKSNINNNYAPPLDIKALKISFQDKIVEDNMKYIQNYLNENFGYSHLKHTANIYRIDSKKYNYETYQNAYEDVVSGYNAIAYDYNKAITKIKSAISIWETELKNYDPLDNKARINSDIAIATNFNLYEAYLWIVNFDEAEEHLSKIIGLNPSKKEETQVKQDREFLKSQRIRYEMMY